MNFGEMKTQVSGLLKDPNNTVVSAVLVGAAINAALSFWKQKRLWFNEGVDASVSISSGNPVIGDMPSDILYPLQRGGIVIDDEDRRYDLQKIRSDEYDAMNREALKRPQFYTLRAGGYEVYPYPDQAYTAVVRYVKDYAAFSGDTDTNDFSSNADWLLIYEAASRLTSDRKQDGNMASTFSGRAKDEYNNLLSRTNLLNATGQLSC